MYVVCSPHLQEYFGANGLNTGTILLHSQLMRKAGLTSEALMKINKEKIELPDQDVYNSYGFHFPSRVAELPCRWNSRPQYVHECKDIDENHQGISHGVSDHFMRLGNDTELGAKFHFFLNAKIGPKKCLAS